MQGKDIACIWPIFSSIQDGVWLFIDYVVYFKWIAYTDFLWGGLIRLSRLKNVSLNVNEISAHIPSKKINAFFVTFFFLSCMNGRFSWTLRLMFLTLNDSVKSVYLCTGEK